MPQRIVDPLEAVQVQEQQRLRSVRAFVAQQCALRRLVEPPPIEQAGQRISDGLILKLLMQMSHYRHV
ncbi:hypothetical protein D3C79_607380 [compost metagenome]